MREMIKVHKSDSVLFIVATIEIKSNLLTHIYFLSFVSVNRTIRADFV
jgi:hypothetical protein